MNRRSLSLLFALFLAIALLVQIPATTLASVVNERTGGRLQLTDGDGSIWSGNGGLSCILPDETAVDCGRWSWSFLPGRLIEGQLSLMIRRQGRNESMLASWAPSGVRLENVALTLPAALIGSLDTKIRALRLSGNLAINSTYISDIAGDATIRWQ